MVTEQYERLTESPQTDIHRADLSLEERAELRHLRVTRQVNTGSPYTGRFTSVFYLEGDERAAAKKFVAENRDLLEQIDYTHPDTIQRSVSRELYDWILHFLGERELRKYQHVVYERRRDGTEWVIDREHFETQPNARYRPQSTVAVARDESLESIFDSLDETIAESDFRDHDKIEGDVKHILEYYRVAGLFDCEPTAVNGQLAVRKLE